GLIVISVIGILAFNLTKAKYQNIEDIELVKGEVNYKIPDFKMMAMYQNNNGSYEEVNELPGKNYKINESKSYCTINNVDKDNKAKLYTDKYGQHIIGNISKNDKCYLYFDKNTEVVSTVLGSIEVNNYTPDFSETATTDEGIFKAEDNDGVSYYWRGAATTNYLKFAGFYWRIVRINGNGSLRLIYNGPTTDQTGETTQIGLSSFNDNYGDNAYVGYMYGTPGSNTYEETHADINDSKIKLFIEDWYNKNIVNKNYSNKIIAINSFCSERSLYQGKGYGKNKTSYIEAFRVHQKIPSLKCSQVSDLFNIPVGLITADEFIMAGNTYPKRNSNSFLYTNETYWTMTPSGYGYAGVFYISANGSIEVYSANGTAKISGVRPVLNIQTTILGGTGTENDPYIV
ncbi:MAG: hypothetical protein OSJ63_05385, partial [Bacilli bacterium]|nr:hypothetical protein [Bacilli bacterium]